MEHFQNIVKSKTSQSRSQNGIDDIQTTSDYFHSCISSTKWLSGELESIIDDLVVDRNPKLTLRHWRCVRTAFGTMHIRQKSSE